MRGSLSLVLLAASASAVFAQPADPAGPLAQVRDEQQIAASLSVITNDPAIPIDDPAIRALAQALMVEGVKQLQAKSYDQALANFLEAYEKFPSPRILLNIASTLRDMGRLADAANTYQRYLSDPATGPERIAEVKEVLLRLDEQLTILTVRVYPSGSDVSIDAGPFIPVGTALLTRVRPGIHLIRVKAKGGSNELTINGFEGEFKEVPATVKLEVEGVAAPEVNQNLIAAPPEKVEGWLITGTQYKSDSATGNSRKVRTGYAGPELKAIVPNTYTTGDDGLAARPSDDDEISSGLVAALRIDGEGRGAAGAFGIAISRNRLEAELLFLKSDSTGGYLGVRYRAWTSWVRPYVGIGVPGFVYTTGSGMGESSTKLAIGIRAAAGVELRINGHLSVKGDIGYEHFFVDENSTGIDANIFVPTLGVIGRL